MGILEGKGLGLEGSGVITEIGWRVNGLAVGDRVCYTEHGCISTRIIVPASRCARIPSNITFEEAATMPCVFGTAIHCLLDIGKLEEGESVLIRRCLGTSRISISDCLITFSRDNLLARNILN
jgi:NADPH:quinone reductase-like Zn-dependent oxidoreductase